MAKVECTCLNCGKQFGLTPSELKRSQGKYCSSACWKASTRVDAVCKFCGNQFVALRKDIKRGRGLYCSNECKYAARNTTVQQECFICGKVFTATSAAIESRGRKYCSKECANLGSIKRLELTCLNCNQPFYVRPSIKKQSPCKYCSRKCRDAARTTKQEIKCQQCGKVFVAKVSDRVKFCSHKCYADSMTIIIECKCLHCGISFSRPRGEINAGRYKYCSRKCSHAHQRGENSIHWRGGSENRFYRGENWYRQRKLVRQRDGDTCQYCQKKRKAGEHNFPVHHIKPYREFNGDWQTANDLSNLILLCHQCHRKCENGLIPTPKRLL